MRKQSKRVAITKRSIETAYLDILSDNSDGKMTVKEVCTRSGVNRTTFYKYYNDLADLGHSVRQGILKELEDTNLPIILGSKLNDQLKKAILENRTSEQVGDTTYEELRLRCVAYLSLKACAQLVRQTGSLTDRGLYFISVASSGENNEVREPADGEAAVRLASTMEQSAAAYSASLTSFIEYYIPDLFTGHDADVLKRDNDHKRTFWAC